jgi:hypothetical protein
VLFKIGVATAEYEAAFVVVAEGFAVDLTGKRVVHGCDTVFGAEGKTLPDAIFGSNEVGEAFADLGEADEGGDVADCYLLKDLSDDFFWDCGDWTWWCWGEFCWRKLALNREAGKFADEGLQRGGETM